MTADTDSTRPPSPLPRWWWAYFVTISAIAVIGLVLGVIGVYANNRQDALTAAENKARDEQTKVLLDCFDDFASDLSGGLPPVRAATATAQDQLSEALATLQAGLVKVSTGAFQPTDLTAIIREFDEYQKANNELVQVRSENPYPEPPSTFCSTR